jgi:thiol peroxidase
MAKVTLKGNSISTAGQLPAVGKAAPNFTVTKTDLSDLSLKDLAGKKSHLEYFPEH